MYRLHLAMNGVQTLVVIGTDYTAVPYDHNHDMYINVVNVHVMYINVVIGTDYIAVPYDHNHDMYINVVNVHV